MTEDITPPTRPLEPQKHAIIIGASSGIGAALARELVQNGYIVAAVARREAILNELCDDLNGGSIRVAHPYVHDVTHYEEVPALFQNIVRDIGGLELIIYVAGIQPAMALNEYDFQKDRQIIETNLFGAIVWLNQAAVRFERAKAGQIVGISSIAGDRGRVASPTYNTSKAGLNTYLEALRNRLSKFGVTVTTIKPGFVDTVLLENAPKTFWVLSPTAAARQIYKAVKKKKQLVYVSARWRIIGLIVQHIPSFIFRRLNF